MNSKQNRLFPKTATAQISQLSQQRYSSQSTRTIFVNQAEHSAILIYNRYHREIWEGGFPLFAEHGEAQYIGGDWPVLHVMIEFAIECFQLCLFDSLQQSCRSPHLLLFRLNCLHHLRHLRSRPPLLAEHFNQKRGETVKVASLLHRLSHSRVKRLPNLPGWMDWYKIWVSRWHSNVIARGI